MPPNDAPLGGQVKKWKIGQASGPDGLGAELMPYAMTLAFTGSFSAGYSRNSKMNCGVVPAWARAGTGTTSSTEYGMRCVHSAPVTTLVRNVASDLPPPFTTSTQTPPGAASAPRSLTVHSAG